MPDGGWPRGQVEGKGVLILVFRGSHGQIFCRGSFSSPLHFQPQCRSGLNFPELGSTCCVFPPVPLPVLDPVAAPLPKVPNLNVGPFTSFSGRRLPSIPSCEATPDRILLLCLLWGWRITFSVDQKRNFITGSIKRATRNEFILGRVFVMEPICLMGSRRSIRNCRSK